MSSDRVLRSFLLDKNIAEILKKLSHVMEVSQSELVREAVDEILRKYLPVHVPGLLETPKETETSEVETETE